MAGLSSPASTSLLRPRRGCPGPRPGHDERWCVAGSTASAETREFVIARSSCDDAIQAARVSLDCVAIGWRFAPTRWLAMTSRGWRNQLRSSLRGALATRQSRLFVWPLDCVAYARNDVDRLAETLDICPGDAENPMLPS